MNFSNPRNPVVQEKIVELYKQGKYPLEIQKELNLKNFQPIFNLLHKLGLYEKRETRYHKKYEIDETFFDSIDMEEKAYILGFIVADGHVASGRQAIVISLNRKDRDILEKIVKAMKSTHPVVDFIKDNKYEHCTVSLNSKSLNLALRRFGLTSNKSLTMTDEIFNHVPVSLQRHFLRGYFDGDGCMTLNKKYSSGIKFLIQIIGTKEFLLGTYNKCFETKCSLMKYKTCEMYCWKVSSKSRVIDFLHYLYDNSTIYLERKYRTFQDYLSECAHVKPGELLEALTLKDAGNQQPSPKGEGSETIERQTLKSLNRVEYTQASGSTRASKDV